MEITADPTTILVSGRICVFLWDGHIGINNRIHKYITATTTKIRSPAFINGPVTVLLKFFQGSPPRICAEHTLWFCLIPPGRLLDATHQYKHVFLLAGCEVTLSAFVLALGNFFCLNKNEGGTEAKMEMAVTKMEMEGLNHVTEQEEQEGDELERKNATAAASCEQEDDVNMESSI